MLTSSSSQYSSLYVMGFIPTTISLYHCNVWAVSTLPSFPTWFQLYSSGISMTEIYESCEKFDIWHEWACNQSRAKWLYLWYFWCVLFWSWITIVCFVYYCYYHFFWTSCFLTRLVLFRNLALCRCPGAPDKPAEAWVACPGNLYRS